MESAAVLRYTVASSRLTTMSMLVSEKSLYSTDQRDATLASSGTGICKRVTIIGLGDLGRSPRMQFHALALADAGAAVDVIAYAGSAPYRRVREHARIRLHLLRAPQRRRAGRAALLRHVLFRVLGDTARLLHALLAGVGKPDVILVQNPPAVPALLIAWVAARLRGARLIIDWHNFGYAMLALRLGPDHLAVRAARWYEQAIGRTADAHLCVSQAMRERLRLWGLEARVLYDRPAEMFAPLAAPERDRFLARWCADLPLAWSVAVTERPAVIVSPTSWTEDEDFTLLLDAVERCEVLLASRKPVSGPGRRLLILLTGVGPLRSQYEAIIRRRTSRCIHVQTAWLAPEDYPLLLGAADLGICVHRSASGVDLPMKVADMLGAGLPVCALNYGPCLAEQIEHGRNGLLFSSSVELAEYLYRLFNDPDTEPRLEDLRRHVAHQSLRWQDGWQLEAAPLFAETRSDG